MTGKHIIVAGYPRSGTTLFYNMLRTSIEGYEFMDRECPASRTIGIDNKNRITKRPKDIFSIGDAVNNNNHDKYISLIILIRDIRAILTSKHKSVPDDYFIGFDHSYFVDVKNNKLI
ncbi:MAG: sulfotransferase, partial [Thiotrichales bacterium]|nr:sulfotransferase [Thiotrichales bacterium]